MTRPHKNRRLVLGLQVAAATAVIVAAGGVRLAALATVAAGAIGLTGQRGARAAAIALLVLVAGISIVAAPGQRLSAPAGHPSVTAGAPSKPGPR